MLAAVEGLKRVSFFCNCFKTQKGRHDMTHEAYERGNKRGLKYASHFD